jgi:hypothetical protein
VELHIVQNSSNFGQMKAILKALRALAQQLLNVNANVLIRAN